MSRWVIALVLSTVAMGCSNGGGDPCPRLCDGIVRCRQGNAMCVAEGMTDREPFYADCIAECEATAEMLTAEEVDSGMLCLDCLNAETNFDSCNGEVLLDETCAGPCRSGGAIPFRNRFGPALFDALECAANPRDL